MITYKKCLPPIIIACIVAAGLGSCAKMPVQALELSQALKDESNRMHEMNTGLVEYIFNEKRRMVSEFISNEYAPAFIRNFTDRLPASTDIRAELPEILQALNPRIDARRDSLLSVLLDQKLMILQKLNDDYKTYTEAYIAIQNLINSAVKVNMQRQSVYDNIKAVSGNRINLQGINNALDNFITGAASVSDKATTLTTSVQTFLK